MKAVITGGGTGGHIYPALAVAKELNKKGWKILYVGSEGGLEGDIIPEAGFDYRAISVAPFYRKLTFKLFLSFLKTTKGFLQSMKIMKKYKPDVVLGTGGYVSGPVVLAGSLLGIPGIIHEQNVYPGVTNRILAHRADAVALNFEESNKYFTEKAKTKMKVTGNPIRQEIINTSRSEGLRELKLDSEKKTLLVFGGSQGAQSINKAMLEVYKYYQTDSGIQIIHITGNENYELFCDMISNSKINMTSRFHILPYLKKMNLAYAAADLVVYRAGATGIAEITARGIPAVLIPYPYAAGNHQEFNAHTLEKCGAALVITDDDLNGKLLLNKIDELINMDSKLKKMASASKKIGNPGAVNNIVELINNITKNV